MQWKLQRALFGCPNHRTQRILYLVSADEYYAFTCIVKDAIIVKLAMAGLVEEIHHAQPFRPKSEACLDGDRRIASSQPTHPATHLGTVTIRAKTKRGITPPI